MKQIESQFPFLCSLYTFVTFSLFHFRLVPHITDRVDSHKGLGVHLADVVHQLSVLIFVHDGDHFHFGGLVIRADALIEGGAAVERMQNKIHDLKFVITQRTFGRIGN